MPGSTNEPTHCAGGGSLPTVARRESASSAKISAIRGDKDKIDKTSQRTTKRSAKLLLVMTPKTRNMTDILHLCLKKAKDVVGVWRGGVVCVHGAEFFF